jgi:MFS family permease
MHDRKYQATTITVDGVLFHDGQDIAEALRNYVPDSVEERALVRKLDLKMMPILWVMYVFNYVDRTNIVSSPSSQTFHSNRLLTLQGNAKIAGMAKDLALDDARYAWVLSIFFFGYLIMEVPSNMALSRSRPKFFLPGIMIIWGILSAMMAISNSYGALLAFRIVLGCVEAGFFPGVLFLLSCWYKSEEIGKRIAIFYTAAVLSGAFGGLISGAVSSHLHDVYGISGWRWLVGTLYLQTYFCIY